VAANVAVPLGRGLGGAKQRSPNPLAGFEGTLRGEGKRGQRKENKQTNKHWSGNVIPQERLDYTNIPNTNIHTL